MVSRSPVVRSLVVLASLALVSCAQGRKLPQWDTNAPRVDQGSLVFVDSALDTTSDATMDATTDAATDTTTDATTDTGADGPGDLAHDNGDLLAGPALVVTQSTGKVELTVAGRFALTFEQQYRWQASSWRDLGTSPTVNLGGPGPTFEHKVVQGPMLARLGGSWQTLQAMQSPTMSVKSASAQQVVLETTWKWELGDGSTYPGKAVHTISHDGTWAVTASLTNGTSSGKTIDMEYADTHVAPVKGWTPTKTADNTSYKLVRTGLPTPRPTLSATRPSAAQGTVNTDEAGNYYWAVSGVKLGAGVSKSWSWTNRIWPGE